MSRLCCFCCPAESAAERSYTDVCPTCGRAFGFPLTDSPATIGQFHVEKALDRGFYSAIYKVSYGALRHPYALKVAPRPLYAYFKKNFEKECREHMRVAEGTEHVVRIRDMFDADVTFGSVTIPCHVAQIDFVPGAVWLSSYITKHERIDAHRIAQLAIDILTIVSEFENHGVRHNDLHDRNILIQELDENSKRSAAVDPFVRAIAVDLGSVSDASRSSAASERYGDIHYVAKHLQALVKRLLDNPAQTTDMDYRLAALLDERLHLLQPAAQAQRAASTDNWSQQWIDDIRRACYQVSAPWSEKLILRRFNDAYNAQTLSPWFIPSLLHDPGGSWLQRVSAPGPLIICGMRGCGKTMLLRSLQLHARAAQSDGESHADVLARIGRDSYIGLYVSCTRLLDRLGQPSEDIHEPYTRLFLGYCLEALRSIAHLRDVDPSVVNPEYYKELATAIVEVLPTAHRCRDAGSRMQLEQELLRMLIDLSRGETRWSVEGHPASTFPHLAEAVRRCGSMLSGMKVFYLFDDVSTRYLKDSQVEGLLSALLFQDSGCAFKITTESQALTLHSPGLVEKAQPGRDYELFDLGADVNSRLKTRLGGGGAEFISEVLALRARHFSGHPKDVHPKRILGDAALEAIANDIASVTADSPRRKHAYRGLTALAGVCVGDIGDVVSIYEMILRMAQGKAIPVPADIQSDCLQKFCSRRLYDLNRREGRLKEVALGFAEAAHALLQQSFKDVQRKKDRRLRQYLSVYVRVTSGNQRDQLDRLRELIDGGVFVFEGGSDAPRSKTRDGDPILQFKMTYRKLFGLSNYIPLSERDRFELSGDDLEAWLASPSRTKELLLRNLYKGDEPEPADESVGGAPPTIEIQAEALQLPLFETLIAAPTSSEGAVVSGGEAAGVLRGQVPQASRLAIRALTAVSFDALVVGLGFEARALTSVRRVSRCLHAARALYVQYRLPGKAKQIRKIVDKVVATSSDVPDGMTATKDEFAITGDTFVDISGMSTPSIFHAVRNVLLERRRVWLAHTLAKTYYPRDADIENVLNAEKHADAERLLKSLGKIMTGEVGPYEVVDVLTGDADESRKRVLFAFVSPKHERLLSLLDERQYDMVELFIPDPSRTNRGRLAKIAADVAARNYPVASIAVVPSNDLQAALSTLSERYSQWYVEAGYNVELALTGSKLQCVAAAAIASAHKVAHCWYMRPQEYDVKRFTKGSAMTSIYHLRLGN